MESEKKYLKFFWIALAIVPILVALISILPELIGFGVRTPPPIHPNAIGVAILPLSPQEKELYDQAVNLWRDGIYTDALRKLDKLISMRPDYVDAYIVRGRIYLEKLKQYQNAKGEFKSGLAKDPHNKYLLYDLGLTYYYMGDFNQAIQFNDSALAQDPDLIIAIYNHAIYHVEYGEKSKDTSYYRKAIGLYENVIARDREFTVSAMFNLAALYARLTKQEKDKNTKDQYVKKAVELLDRAIDREGCERLKKVTGEIHVQYGEDLEAIRHDPDYKRMIEKWWDRCH
jgi:tetratricopeptide (TPR) repeat protein